MENQIDTFYYRDRIFRMIDFNGVRSVKYV